MKRMHPFVAFMLGTLLGAGVVAFRNALRNAPDIAEPSELPARDERQAVDQLQSTLQFDTAGKYQPDASQRQLFEKMWQEERRQRPEEGRN
jgi:hypothetical protein